jgi:hypothetical protein
MKYLDETGLSYFWNKIKANIPDDYISNNLKVISDCNDTSLGIGFYYANSNTLNTPHTSAWFLHVIKKVFDDGSVDVITQVAYRYRDNEVWIRQYNNVSSTGWKQWQPLHQDSGWITPSLNSSFKVYNSDSTNAPKYRKIGKMVEIVGVVSPASEIASGGTGNIFTLPEGYRPTQNRYYICQGSGRNVWLLTVNPNGTVSCSRYGTSSNVAISTSAWLPFNATFLID